MSLPFRRCARRAQGADGAPICSFTSPEQRLWEVQTVLCTLSPELREALLLWLFNPTDLRRWPPLASFNHQRLPIGPQEMKGELLSTGCKLLREELQAIRQTLDFPPEAMSGLTRNGLLTVHGIRLRQLERWLWPICAVREIKRLIA
jgi:hypothetical protein